eukprot:COSAG02_NODE_17874_length_974_cov_1.235429_2_plen_26_part_01
MSFERVERLLNDSVRLMAPTIMAILC